jgi:replication factor C subunit 2/4
MKARLQSIAQAEGCEEGEMNLLDEILQQADGDMRRAVTTLQSVHSLAVGGETITSDTLAEIAGHPPPGILRHLWQDAIASSTSFDAMQAAVQDICAQGYAAKFLLLGLLPLVAESTVLSERYKAEIALRMAEAEKNMAEGADEFLQLMTVCSLAFSCLRATN